MHQTTRDFMDKVKAMFPTYFKDSLVLDVGSQDINGTNKHLFDKCEYIGIDLGQGRNVDFVCHVNDYFPKNHFDTIISTNAFEHDSRYLDSLRAIAFRLLKPNGLFAFSCSSTGFPEHGTTLNHPGHSPYTNDHYKNLTEADIREAVNIDKVFFMYEFSVVGADLQFWGIKNEN